MMTTLAFNELMFGKEDNEKTVHFFFQRNHAPFFLSFKQTPFEDFWKNHGSIFNIHNFYIHSMECY